MDAHGVHVFHVADGDGGVVFVAHHFIFNFLVALDTLFHQHLTDRGEFEGVFHNGAQLLVVAGKAAARAAERESRAQNHRVADVVRGGKPFFDGVDDDGRQHRLAQFLAELLKQLAILGAFDGGAARAQQFHLALAQYALLFKLHGQIQPRLAADAGHNGVRALVAEDFGQVLQLQRLHIHLVGNGRVRHDGGGVGVDEDHLVAFLLQRQAGLRARVVELRGLADDDGAGTNDQYFVNIGALRHGAGPPSCSE